MLKEQARLITKLNILMDVSTICTAFWLSYQIRGQYGGLLGMQHYSWVLLVVIPLWMYLLKHFGLYYSQRTSSFRDLLVKLAKVHLSGGIIVSSAIYLAEPHGYSRGFFGLFITLLFFMLGTEQLVARSALRQIRQQGYNFRNILVVGTQRSAEKLIDLIELHKSWGLRIAGIIQPEEGELKREVRGQRVIGTLDSLVQVCKKNPIDEVIFCSSHEECTFDIAHYMGVLDELGITVRTVLAVSFNLTDRTEFSVFHDQIPLLTLKPTALTNEQLFVKRCIDIAGSIVGLALALLLAPFIALAIKLESPGPLFFGQTRVGLHGRTFTCWKFRTMFVDAEERKKELMHLNEMGGAIFKIANDPRITRVGRFLRKTSLDELPQFWNVFKGEMSLVGTRPPTPDEVEHYENWQRKRICMKPGITGLWQVSGRNSIKDFDEIVRLDLRYMEEGNLWLDIKLLFKTVKVVFLREGAS